MSLKLVRRQEQIEFITTEGEEKKFIIKELSPAQFKKWLAVEREIIASTITKTQPIQELISKAQIVHAEYEAEISMGRGEESDARIKSLEEEIVTLGEEIKEKQNAFNETDHLEDLVKNEEYWKIITGEEDVSFVKNLYPSQIQDLIELFESEKVNPFIFKIKKNTENQETVTDAVLRAATRMLLEETILQSRIILDSKKQSNSLLTDTESVLI